MKTTVWMVTVSLLLATSAGCKPQEANAQAAAAAAAAYAEPKFGEAVEPGSDVAPGDVKLRKAVFAGGCFWCMEPDFDKVDGVVATVSGYIGGKERNPTYKQVASGATGHTEAALIVYDPKRVTYAALVEVFWRTHDPTDGGGQFADRGRQYRPGIFPYTKEQREVATRSRDNLAASGRFKAPIAAEITDATTFWPAEEAHQNYYLKASQRYKAYRKGSGREAFVEDAWK